MMRKYGLFSFLLVLFSLAANAQGMRMRSNGEKQAQSFYAEGGGPGIITLNYDQRFLGQTGLGFRIGLGGWGFLKKGVFTAPAGLNFITGSDGHFADIGAGFVFASASSGNKFFDNEGSSVSAYFNFGYRYQPMKNGLTYRIFLCPLLTPAGTIPFYAGASVGLKF